MKDFIILIVFFFLSIISYSQDKIVKINNDTADCEMLNKDCLSKVYNAITNYNFTRTIVDENEIMCNEYVFNVRHRKLSAYNLDCQFLVGFNIGVSCSYSDKAFNYSFPVGSISLDYHIKSGYYAQVAPKYSWLFLWNEHYFTLPLHIRKQFNKHFSAYVGPCITWDIGNFRDVGLSAGIYFHFGKSSSIVISTFTFTLYDYYIDYRYIPVGISYNIFLFKRRGNRSNGVI